MKFTPGSRDVEVESAIADSLIVREEQPILVRLVTALQQASAPVDFYRLQHELLQRTFARQSVTDELRQEIKDTKRALRELTSKRPLPKADVQRAQELLTNQEFAERCCKAVTHALRCVGDGIVWKALRYDRGAISVLGSGKRVGRLADTKGLDAELAAAAAHWSRTGSFAIHNDLTNCLRTSDLTLPFEPGGNVVIHEVKAGTSQRTAQTNAAEERIEFLRNGRGAVMGANGASLARFRVAMRTDLHVLRRLLAEARRDGYGRAQPSSSVALVAVDPRLSGGDPGIDVVAEQARAAVGWYDDPRIVMTVSMVRRARERLHHFPYLAPLTVYPLPAEDVVELMLGPLEYVTILHAPSLEREFASHGILARVVTHKPEADRVFLRADRGDTHVDLPSLLCEQMLTELLQPACLVRSVSAMCDAIEAGAALGPTVVCLDDEARTWR